VRALLVDNYDSFTYNLAQLLGRVSGWVPTVLRNDDRRGLAAIDLRDYDAVVVSPGPGTPQRERDFGISRWAVSQSRLPVLGICLGHQGLWAAYGARVARAPEPMHGRLSDVFHDGDPLFDGIPSPFAAVRYHSLLVHDLPEVAQAIAHTGDGLLMAARHRGRAAWGVQFHPESIATAHGERLIANFRDLVRASAAGTFRSTTRLAPPVTPATPAVATAVPAGPQPGAAGLTVTVREVPGGVADAEAAFAALFGRYESAFWLDSARVIPGLSRFSVLGAAAGPLGEVLTADVRRREVRVRTGTGAERRHAGGFFDHLGAALRERRIAPSGLPFDFDLGYVGYLGYELKAECGGAAAHPAAQPDAALVFADRALVVDHRDQRAWLLALGTPAEPGDGWLDGALAQLRAVEPLPPLPPVPAEGVAVSARHDESAYTELIAACQEAIAAGESYEICLTNMHSLRERVDPWLAYRLLRRANPAPFAAYLRLPGFSVLSSSPERFLGIDPAGMVEAKPIKGTRPRGATPEQDARLAAQLRADEKERAENLMIVDLLRNDLGRTAALGSVHVPVLFGVESYETVHHLVSTVRAELAPGAQPLDCVRAAFPGGSMTGAPKLRTLEILDALEGGARGVYSGAIGYFSLSGAVDLSMAIRCLVVTPDEVTLGAGGAITALSDPAAEIEETRVKAGALLRTLAAATTPVATAR
jgi:para-aminobenzoate synthetase